MKPRIKIYLEFDTVAHGQTIRNSIRNHIAGKDLFDTIMLTSGRGNETDLDVLWGVAEFRFNSLDDRNELVDWIKDQVQNHPQVKTWVLKARVTKHLCSQDDPEAADCKTGDDYSEWTR